MITGTDTAVNLNSLDWSGYVCPTGFLHCLLFLCLINIRKSHPYSRETVHSVVTLREHLISSCLVKITVFSDLFLNLLTVKCIANSSETIYLDMQRCVCYRADGLVYNKRACGSWAVNTAWKQISSVYRIFVNILYIRLSGFITEMHYW